MLSVLAEDEAEDKAIPANIDSRSAEPGSVKPVTPKVSANKQVGSSECEGSPELLALVDAEDQPHLAFRWRVSANGWVRRYREGGKQKAVYLHREILGLTGDQSVQVLFRNKNCLDCRRVNLKAVTMSELRSI